MKIERNLKTPNKTLTKFNNTRRLSQDHIEIPIASAKSVVNEDDTSNLFGKLKHLETEISEVYQVLNIEK